MCCSSLKVRIWMEDMLRDVPPAECIVEA